MIGLIAFLFTFVPVQDEAVLLRWKFAKGQALRYEMKTVGEAAGISQSYTMSYAMTVTEVGEDGSAQMKVKYERIAIKMSGFQEVDYDSARDKTPPDNIMAQLMAGFVGPSYEMKVAKTGAILEVRGMADFMKKVEASVGEKHRAVVGRVALQYTDEAMKNMMAQAFPGLPDRPVKKGETWNSTAKVPFPGGMGKVDYRFEHLLRDVRKGEAVIVQKTRIERGKMGGVEFKGGAGSNEILFLVDRGVMKSLKGAMEMKMEAGGQEMTNKTTIEMRLLPEK